LPQGSDGAGSIRMPAHFSGVFGLKPTYGRVPQSPVAASDHTVHLGPLTRTVADAALMLRTMAGPHPDDHTSLEALPADYPRHLQRRPRAPRIAYSPDLDHARVDPEVAELVAKAVGAFEKDLGWRVEQVKTPWGPRARSWRASSGRRISRAMPRGSRSSATAWIRASSPASRPARRSPWPTTRRHGW
jgi:aspartyl-tRNA(Asn)/glutamyl-tRNA(Gln) amidotransferase subunit A